MPTSINKKRESEILKLIKSKAKIYNWNGRGFQIFKIVEQFLFSASIFVDGKNNSLNGIMQFKPSNIDNLFCEIIDKEDYFRTGPLFYKVNSSGMVYPYYCYEFTLNEINESKLEKLINEFEEKIEYVIKNFSDKDNYYQFIKEQLEIEKDLAYSKLF